MFGKKSIKTKLLVFFVALVTISIIITAFLGINSTIVAGDSIEQSTRATLNSQAESYLVQLTEATAEKNDRILENVKNEAGNVAGYARNMLENPGVFDRNAYWRFDDHIFMGNNGQHLNGKDDVSAVFIPDFINISDKAVRDEVESGAYLDFIFPKVLENSPNTVAIWTVGVHGTSRYYPNIGLGNIVPPDQVTTEEIFVKSANPRNNPGREVVWIPVYDDPAGQGLMISAVAPVYTEQKGFVGVVGIDVTLNTLIKNIENYTPVESSYAFLIDNEGYSVALPEQAYKDILGRSREANVSRVNLNNLTNGFGPVINKMKGGSHGFQNISAGDKELYVSYAPLKSTGFSLAIVADREVVLKTVGVLQKEIEDSVQKTIYTRILPMGMLILLATLILGFLLTDRMFEPIKKLTDSVKEISRGNLYKKIEVKSDDEIGELTESFNTMTENLLNTTVSKNYVDDILRSMFDMLVVLTPDNTIRTVNKTTCDVLGYRTEELAGQPLEILLADGNLQPEGAWIGELIGKGAFNNTEKVFTTKNGRKIPVVFSASVMYDKDGRIQGIVCVAHDITERIKAEKAIVEKEREYRTILRTTMDGFWITDINGRFLDVNDAYCRLIGYSRAELLAMGIQDIEEKERPEDTRQRITRIRELGFDRFETRHRCKDGRIVDVEVSVNFLGADEARLFVFLRDITERKQAEENLRVVTEKYTKAFLLAPDAITVSELESGRFIEVNDAACHIFGFSREELIGKSAAELGIWLEKEDRDALIGQVRTRGRVIQYEVAERRKSGELFSGSITADIMDIGNARYLITTNRDITDHKQAEENLRIAQEKYTKAFLLAPDAITVSELESGRFVEVNDAASHIYGFSRDEMIGKSAAELGIWLEKEDRDAFFEQLRIRGRVVQYEITERNKSGELIDISVSADTMIIGNISYLIAVIRDITDRKLAEQELKESESRYCALFTNNNSVSLLIDPDTGRIIDANEAAVRYYGYSRDQLTALGIYNLNRLPEDTVVRNLKRAKDEKERHFFSAHYRADGEKRYVEIYSGPIRVRGKPLFYSIIHDITDRKQAEQALRESEGRYRTLVDQLPDYVIVHREGILLYANPAAASQFGYAVEQVIGRPILSFIAPEYHDTVRQAMIRRMAGEDIPAYEMKIRAKDGTFRTVLVNGAAIMFEGGLASLNVLSDITTIKQAEETIRSANEVLEKRVAERTEALSRANVQLTAEIAARTRAEEEITRSLEEKDLLLREIHHRVKNNLQIIASLLKLQSRTITDPNVLEAIRNSQSRIRAMALVHERIYRSYNIAEINLKDYLDYLTKQIFQFYNIQQHQIGITVTMDEIMADIDTITPLGLIVNELVSNSLKYAFPDGRKGAISIECTQQDKGMIRFVYHDNGIGMPVGFDWKNTESLGLRLVNSLVDQLNGTIESGEGEGTTFIITIQKKRESLPS